jgi:hemoglobin
MSADKSLYERLGGAKGIAGIADDLWLNHTRNPLVRQRYVNSDPEKVKRLVREMLGAGPAARRRTPARTCSTPTAA